MHMYGVINAPFLPVLRFDFVTITVGDDLTARKILDSLQPKWDSRTEGNTDSLDGDDLTRAENELAATTDGPITFIPAIESSNRAQDEIRIFQKKNGEVSHPRLRMTDRPIGPPNSITAYIEGVSAHENTEQGRAAGGVWFSENNPKNFALRVRGSPETELQGRITSSDRVN